MKKIVKIFSEEPKVEPTIGVKGVFRFTVHDADKGIPKDKQVPFMDLRVVEREVFWNTFFNKTEFHDRLAVEETVVGFAIKDEHLYQYVSNLNKIKSDYEKKHTELIRKIDALKSTFWYKVYKFFGGKGGDI